MAFKLLIFLTGNRNSKVKSAYQNQLPSIRDWKLRSQVTRMAQEFSRPAVIADEGSLYSGGLLLVNPVRNSSEALKPAGTIAKLKAL